MAGLEVAQHGGGPGGGWGGGGAGRGRSRGGGAPSYPRRRAQYAYSQRRETCGPQRCRPGGRNHGARRPHIRCRFALLVLVWWWCFTWPATAWLSLQARGYHRSNVVSCCRARTRTPPGCAWLAAERPQLAPGCGRVSQLLVGVMAVAAVQRVCKYESFSLPSGLLSCWRSGATHPCLSCKHRRMLGPRL